MSRATTPDALRGGDGRPSSPLARIASALEMELRLTGRRLENLFVTLVLPVVLLLFFGSVDILPAAATATPGSRPIDAVLPAILATAIVAAGLVNLGISTGFERSYGVLKRLGGSPLTRGQLLVAKIATIVVVEVVQAVLLIGLAIAVFGWRPAAGWDPLAVGVAIALGTGAFSALGGLLVPAHQLPGVLGAFASLLPSAALADSLRISLGSSTGDIVGPLLLLGAWAAGASALTAHTFRWE